MADFKFPRLSGLLGMMRDMGDGTHAEVVATSMTPSDRAALDAAGEVYTNVAPYSGATTAGRAVLIICSAAGTATLTFAGGGTVTIPVEVGLSLLPFALTNAAQTTGTMALYKLS